MGTQPDQQRHDERLRIVAVVLEPALVLARALAVPLDELLDTVAVGYFRAHQERGLSFTSIARRLGKSRRTVAHLARAAKAPDPQSQSDLITLRRLIVERLGRKGPAEPRGLSRHFGKISAEHLQQELAVLTASGVVELRGGKYRVAAPFLSLVGPDLEQRLASLRQFMMAVAHGVYQRFFGHPGRTESFARVLSFRATRTRLKNIGNDTYADLRRAVLDADAHADGLAKQEGVRHCSAILLVTEDPVGPSFGD